MHQLPEQDIHPDGVTGRGCTWPTGMVGDRPSQIKGCSQGEMRLSHLAIYATILSRARDGWLAGEIAVRTADEVLDEDDKDKV